jgi:antitoxin Phd
MSHWQLQEAKARLSELIKEAAIHGPQHITVHEKPAVVVLSEKEYKKLTQPKQTFLEFLEKSPLKGIELNVKKDKSLSRDIDL